MGYSTALASVGWPKTQRMAALFCCLCLTDHCLNLRDVVIMGHNCTRGCLHEEYGQFALYQAAFILPHSFEDVHGLNKFMISTHSFIMINDIFVWFWNFMITLYFLIQNDPNTAYFFRLFVFPNNCLCLVCFRKPKYRLCDIYSVLLLRHRKTFGVY